MKNVLKNLLSSPSKGRSFLRETGDCYFGSLLHALRFPGKGRCFFSPSCVSICFLKVLMANQKKAAGI